MSARSLTIAAVVLLVAVAGWFAYSTFTASPEYSLLQIKKAFDTHDVALFERHVDVESLIVRAVDAAMGEAFPQAPAAELGDGVPGTSAGGEMMAKLKLEIVEFAKNRILMAVEGRSEEAAAAETGGVAAASMWQFEDLLGGGAGEDEDPFSAPSIRREGSVAYLGIERFNQSLGEALTLEFKMEEMGGHWRVVELSNLREVMARASQLREARLAEINAPIKAQMDSAIRVTDISKQSSEESDSDMTVLITATVTNLTNRTIESADITIAIQDAAGGVVGTLDDWLEELEPGQEEEVEFELEIEAGEGDALYGLPDGSVGADVQITSIEFDDGEVWEMATAL